jgi:competence protein ComEA
MNWAKISKDYFTFSKKDRIAILVLTVSLLAVFFLPRMLRSSKTTVSTVADTSWVAAVKRLEQKNTDDEGTEQYQQSNDNTASYTFDKSSNTFPVKTKGALFYFNPNTLSKEGWEKLGLRDKTIQTIQNYLSKGGHFKKPGDLQKVYGLHQDEYERLAPYIQLENAIENNTQKTYNENNYTQDQKRTNTYARFTTVEINTADTTSFIALPGIGSKLAARIISFREKLGGFSNVEQVKETYGLPDSTFQRIKPYLQVNTAVKKININTATVDQLKAHPYIRYTLANPIIAYRNEHGAFTRLEDIKKIMVITEEVFQKISPYLSIK